MLASLTRYPVWQPTAPCLQNRLRGKMLQTELYVARRSSVNLAVEVFNGHAAALSAKPQFNVDGTHETSPFL
jgi:hypothetical protein